MKKIDIASYGTRYKWGGILTTGEGRITELHIPNKPSMKHAFTKMLFMIALNPYKTRKEIFKFYEDNEIIQKIFEYGNSFSPYIDHYWSDLHRLNYICQYKTNKNKIVYTLTPKGVSALLSIPYFETRLFGINHHLTFC